jgi:2-octaprenylphenol hydroxylase
VSDAARFDVIIVGAGLVGMTLANALGKYGVRVALVEAGAIPKDKPALDNFDLRVSAITRGSQQIFTTLDVWDGMVGQRVHPFYEMHVWDAAGRGEIHFDSADLAEPCLGHIIENGVIHYALWQALQACEQVQVFEQHPAHALSVSEAEAQLHLQDGAVLRGALVVGADGAESWVRKQADIGVHGRDYQQSALVTNVKTEHAHRDTAWQRFLPNGPLAFLPLSQGYSSIVWSTTPEEADELRELDETEFALRLQAAFEDRLGAVAAPRPRGVFALRFLAAEHYVQPRVALVGDAAHTIHPLAGQGVNLGLADAASLAELVVEAMDRRRDPGAFKVLRAYERWRRAENSAMMSVVNGFQRLYGTQWGPVPWLRNSGMQVLDRLGMLKTVIIEHAMGQRGDLPRLSRGRALKEETVRH